MRANSSQQNGYQPSPEYPAIKRMYRKIVDDAENGTDFESVSFAAHDSCVSVENQQWEVTWSHVMSMIGEVVPYRKPPPASSSEKRMDLVDMVAQLVQVARTAKESRCVKRECSVLKKQLEEARVKIEEQEKEIRKWRETKLTGQINDMRTRVKVHIDEQQKLLGKLEADEKRRRCIERRLNLETATRETKGERRRPRRHRRIVITEYSDDEVDLENGAERAKRGKAVVHRCQCLRNVNRLIETANQIKRDYVELGKVMSRPCSCAVADAKQATE